MPLAECNICNRRFHGKYSVRNMHVHQASAHKKHNGTVPDTQSPFLVEPLVNAVWNSLSFYERYTLIKTFFTQKAHDTNPGGQHDNDTVDGEVISERRAG